MKCTYMDWLLQHPIQSTPGAKKSCLVGKLLYQHDSLQGQTHIENDSLGLVVDKVSTSYKHPLVLYTTERQLLYHMYC